MLDNWGIFCLLGYKCVFQYGLFIFFKMGAVYPFSFGFHPRMFSEILRALYHDINLPVSAVSTGRPFPGGK